MGFLVKCRKSKVNSAHVIGSRTKNLMSSMIWRDYRLLPSSIDLEFNYHCKKMMGTTTSRKGMSAET